jgi:hypothetical protein
MTPFLRHLGIFQMPQIFDMGQTALFPFRINLHGSFTRMPKQFTYGRRAPVNPAVKFCDLTNDHTRGVLNCSWLYDLITFKDIQFGKFSYTYELSHEVF